VSTCPVCGQTQPQRWRNDGPPPQVIHVAGPVINSVEYRRSCPGYIVDRRQACDDCGRQLVRGRWAVFFAETALVIEHGAGMRVPIFHYADHRHQHVHGCADYLDGAVGAAG
jgi:hypothetical protein